LGGLARNDDAVCLAGLSAWIAAWDDVFWEGDVSDLFPFYTTDCRLEAHIPLVGEVYRGHAGIRAWRNEIVEAVSSFRFHVDRFERAGARIAGLGRLTGTGRFTGFAPDVRWGVVWLLDGDQIARGDAYPSHAAALSALGRRSYR
jgi:hypothetical protein